MREMSQSKKELLGAAMVGRGIELDFAFCRMQKIGIFMPIFGMLKTKNHGRQRRLKH
jgi:hypothetical protein